VGAEQMENGLNARGAKVIQFCRNYRQPIQCIFIEYLLCLCVLAKATINIFENV